MPPRSSFSSTTLELLPLFCSVALVRLQTDLLITYHKHVLLFLSNEKQPCVFFMESIAWAVV